MPENYPADFDTRIKMVVYRATAESGNPPSMDAVADKVGESPDAIKESYARLRASRLLLLEADGATVRMAPPFSGVPTQHRVRVDEIEYYANCAWDALGIRGGAAPAGPGSLALRTKFGTAGIASRHERAGTVDLAFHCLVPAAKWWDDLVFT